ncbi:MAG: ArgE/DapE family deacylase [Gammaproteobacteria bacterium]|nr:ArgE/DapE family deacylase [Gammaproteobacteria bacterium]
MAAKILKQVDDGFGEQIEFTRELIRYPSQRGHEHTAQDFVFNSLRDRGYKMDRWSIDIDEIREHPGFSPVTVNYDNAVNVIGTHHPRSEQGKSLILNGHIDVVPAGPVELWNQSPYDPVIEDDWLFGRGSADMKAGLTANIFALDALRHLGYLPASTVYIQSVTEEECTGNGSLACLARGYRADAAVIPEPEDDKLVRANVGVIWFKVHCRGLAAHVREAGTGANAIEASFHLIEALKKLEIKWNADKHNYPYFGDVDKPININIGKIHGGDWASSVPSWCTIDARASIYPGIDPRAAAKEIEACLAEASRSNAFLEKNPPDVEYNGFFAQGYVLEEGSEAEQILGRAHATSFGKSLESFVTPGYLDGRVFVLYDDCPALVYGPISKDIHGVNECVSLASVKRITGTIALFIAQWCGLEKI